MVLGSCLRKCCGLGTELSVARRKHKAVSKGPGLCVVCGSHSGVGMVRCGETGQHCEAGGGWLEDLTRSPRHL